MAIFLLDSRLEPQRIDEFADRGFSALSDSGALAGPAVIMGSPADGSASDALVSNSRQITGVIASRPMAYREQNGDWIEVDFEAADHWMQMSDRLRRRLIDDTSAALEVKEFKQVTNGASASLITNNWVYSGSPRVYRAAGPLRGFITVLGELTRS